MYLVKGGRVWWGPFRGMGTPRIRTTTPSVSLPIYCRGPARHSMSPAATAELSSRVQANPHSTYLWAVNSQREAVRTEMVLAKRWGPFQECRPVMGRQTADERRSPHCGNRSRPGCSGVGTRLSRQAMITQTAVRGRFPKLHAVR